MTDREQLLQELEQAPDPVISEVLNFLLSVKARQSQKGASTSHDRITGLFADEPEAMQQIMDWVEQDRELDRQRSLE